MILFGYYENYIKNENGFILFKHVDQEDSAYIGNVFFIYLTTYIYYISLTTFAQICL